MSQYALDSFGGYQKAKELFALVVKDTGELRKDARCYRLIAQRVGSADSVCANILTKTMETLRRELQKAPGQTSYLREEANAYGTSDGFSPSPLDSRPSPQP